MPQFNGSNYEPEHDFHRLKNQHDRVRNAMLRGGWYTLGELEAATGDPAASISAQLRHLRKPRFGGWIIEKRRRMNPKVGLWEYRITGKVSRERDFAEHFGGQVGMAL